ncbi:MAG: hypothetical protein VYD57_18675 [Pseudomonadota bacterium]|nr:hypothetical protein [Pseudomonadota bacterium]
MPQRPLLVLEGVDIRRVSATGESRANIITKMTVPPLRKKTVAHDPGGGNLEVNYALRRIEALEPAFAAPLDISLFDGFGEVDQWIMAGVYRDADNGNVPLAFRAIVTGVLNAWEPAETDPAEFHSCNYMFAEVTDYEATLDGREFIYVSRSERATRYLGKEYFPGFNRALGV